MHYKRRRRALTELREYAEELVATAQARTLVDAYETIGRRMNPPHCASGVRHWAYGTRPVPGIQAIALEQATEGKVPRYVSAPEFYPPGEYA